MPEVVLVWHIFISSLVQTLTGFSLQLNVSFFGYVLNKDIYANPSKVIHFYFYPKELHIIGQLISPKDTFSNDTILQKQSLFET